MEVILITLVTMIEAEKILFWLYNVVGGLFIFGGVLLKQRSLLWWGFAVKLGLLPFQQWVLLVIPQVGYATFIVLNLLKIPVLYFIRAVNMLTSYVILYGSFFYALFLLRQTHIVYEFVCINTILGSVNMVLLGGTDYLYYFWSNILVMLMVLFLNQKVGMLHLLGLPGGLLFFPKIQVLLSLSGFSTLLMLSGFQALYLVIAKWWTNSLIRAYSVLRYFGMSLLLL